MVIVNFTKNNQPFEAWEFDGSYEPNHACDRAIDLDQFLYDLDKQILILDDELYSVTNDDRGYDHEQGMQEYASVLGQITSLELIRSQFDGF